jgi:putative ABC transport system substrate-binding protein
MWALGREEDFRLAFTLVVAPERLDGFARLLSTRSRKLIGVSIEIPPDKQLELLLRIVPDLRRIGVLTNGIALRSSVAKLKELCDRSGIQLAHAEVPNLSDFPARLQEILDDVDLVWSLPDPGVCQSEVSQRIITLCAERKVPLLGISSTFVKSGAAISFDPDYHEVGQLLARQCRMADELPDGLTIVAPQTIVVSINDRLSQVLKLATELDMPEVRISRF